MEITFQDRVGDHVIAVERDGMFDIQIGHMEIFSSKTMIEIRKRLVCHRLIILVLGISEA